MQKIQINVTVLRCYTILDTSCGVVNSRFCN